MGLRWVARWRVSYGICEIWVVGRFLSHRHDAMPGAQDNAQNSRPVGRSLAGTARQRALIRTYDELGHRKRFDDDDTKSRGDDEALHFAQRLGQRSNGARARESE